MAAVRESAVGRGRAPLAGMELDRMTEAEVVEAVLEALDQRRGGWVATPNVDICRAARHDPQLAAVMASASLSVPDGMPLIWATRLRGDKLPERITGASLIFSLSEAAAASGRSVYYLGGLPGVPEQAAARLGARYPGLLVAGPTRRRSASTPPRRASRRCGPSWRRPRRTSCSWAWASPSRRS